MRKKYIAIIICVIFIALIILFSNIFLIKTVNVVFEKQPVYTNEEEIITASKIEMKTNIFNLNEKRLKDNITGYFSNNTVSVTDVQRKFPNEVNIYIKERLPLLIVPYGSVDGNECVPTDMDFQLVSRCNKNDIDFDAISISGIYVESTFNLASFRQINSILRSFIEMSFNHDSMVAFIKEINVSTNRILIILRNGDGVFEIDTSSQKSVDQQTKELYQMFLDLPYGQRDVFNLSL